MLLHRLVEHAASTKLPPAYYRPKQIHWALVIDEEGSRAQIFSRRPPKGSKEPAMTTEAPYAYRSGKMPPPFLLVDSAQYVLGHPKPDPATGEASTAASEEAARRREEYVELIRAWADAAPDDARVQTTRRYFDGSGPLQLRLPEDLLHSDTVAVMLSEQWLHLLPSAQQVWAETVRRRKTGNGAQGVCLVCGQDGELLATIPESIKSGSIPTSGLGKDAQLVSINAAAQGRGGLLQLGNTPVCEPCGSRSMAALNALLADDDHRRRGTESVTVWWTREPIEDQLFAELDDPTPEAVARLLDSLNNHPDPVTAQRIDANAYYALTLGLNNARVVVRDWLDIPLRQVRANIHAWFQDHAVFDGWTCSDRYVPIWLMAKASGRWDSKANKYAPKSELRGLDQDLLRAALHRSAVPNQVLPHLLQRIRADRRLDAPRIALIRLLLNPSREERTRPVTRLDQDSTEVAYLCGRTFAIFEAVQRAALPEVNTTIGDKFFGTAMTAPAAVFTSLRRGANAHFKRLRRDKPGTCRALETRLSSVFEAIAKTPEAEIPAVLNMRQQARFVLGYEQQRAEDNAARAAHKAQREQAAASAEAAADLVPTADPR